MCLSTVIKILTKGLLSKPAVSVYSDPGMTQPVSPIDWGEMDGGVAKAVTIYAKNSGNVAVILTVSTNNLSPSELSSKMIFSVDSVGKTVPVNGSLPVKFTLTIDGSATFGSFSFDIMIQVSKAV